MAKKRNKKRNNSQIVALFLAAIVIGVIALLVSQRAEQPLENQTMQSAVSPPVSLPTAIPESFAKAELSNRNTVESSPDSPILTNSVELDESPKVTPSHLYVTRSEIGNHVVSLHRDAQNRVWCGTEDQGVFCAESADLDRWRQFTTKDGLGDDSIYALCSDQHGRIWVGHQFSGVSVFNGLTWKNYPSTSGPLGERVFDIACDPIGGDIWIATNLGLSRYSDQSRSWSYLTRGGWFPVRDSLETTALHVDEIEALAFADDGTLYAGSKTQGLGIGKRNDDYGIWQSVKAPTSSNFSEKMTGRGIPCDQINDVLVAKDGTVFVATVRGLARSKDSGVTWEFVRGRDAIGKVKESFDGPSSNWREPTNILREMLLPEDYITALAEDDEGRIWMAFRIEGLFIGHEASKLNLTLKPDELGIKTQGDCVITDILPVSDGTTWVGGYGNGTPGLQKTDIGLPGAASVIAKTDIAQNHLATSTMPTEAAPPSSEQLKQLRRIIEESKIPFKVGFGAYIGEDWSTKGDWVGRYGRGNAMLCAMDAPMDHVVGYGTHYSIRGFTGSNGEKGEALRHWCHKVRWDDRRVLYNPIIGYRRQAEWDDHAEAYPLTHEGPDIWVEVDVHEGVHEVALYFFNKDGITGRNRLRDYLIELKPYAENERRAYNSDPIARARVREFRGGVYHTFVVTGPSKYWIKVACNDSFNTILSGIFCRPLAGEWKYEDWSLPWMGGVSYAAPRTQVDSTWSETLRNAHDLWNSTTPNTEQNALEASRPARLLALRTAIAESAPPSLIDAWRWELKAWSSKDRKDFDEKMAAGFAAVKKKTEKLSRQTPEYLHEKYFKKKLDGANE